MTVVGTTFDARTYARRFDWDEAKRLYESGANGPEIAARCGVTQKAVYDALDKLGVERRSRATSVREDELQCVTCRQWKHDLAFPHNRIEPARRGRHTACSSCQTEIRRAYRERRKIPCTRCGEPRLPQSEKASSGRDSGLCVRCYHAGRPPGVRRSRTRSRDALGAAAAMIEELVA